MPIDLVDLSEESGWRALCPERVEELVKTFLEGNYGLNILGGPMVRGLNGEPQLGKSGKTLLADGKHKFAALQQCFKKYEDPDEHDKYEWTAELEKVFQEGLLCGVWEFPDDNLDMIMAYQVAAHEETSNRAAWSNLADFVAVAQRFQKKTLVAHGPIHNKV